MTNDDMIVMMLEALYAAEHDPKAILHEQAQYKGILEAIEEFLLSFTSAQMYPDGRGPQAAARKMATFDQS